MRKIIGIGNALVDVVTLINDDKVLDSFNLPKGSMQLVDKPKSELIKSGTAAFEKRFVAGGSAANTIHGIAMLGADAGFIGSVGKDDTGDFFEDDMKRAGVQTFLSRRNSITGTSVALISPDSERTMATHLGAAIELTPEDITEDLFKGFDILYLEGYLIIDWPLIEKACSIAKQFDMKIALDLASYNVVEANKSHFQEILEKYVDIVFANEEEAKSFTGLAPFEALNVLSSLSDIAIVKVGKEGSIIKRGEEIIKIGTLDVNSIDTTGAGDLYASGFLYGHANDFPLDKCGLIGSVLAGNIIEVHGAKMDDERWSEIRKMINTDPL